MTLFNAFQSNSLLTNRIATAKANLMITDNGEAVAVIDKADLDSIQMVTGIDLSGVDSQAITSETELKKSLIAAIGSFLTMVLLALIKAFFPAMREKLKRNS